MLAGRPRLTTAIGATAAPGGQNAAFFSYDKQPDTCNILPDETATPPRSDTYAAFRDGRSERRDLQMASRRCRLPKRAARGQHVLARRPCERWADISRVTLRRPQRARRRDRARRNFSSGAFPATTAMFLDRPSQRLPGLPAGPSCKSMPTATGH